MTRADRLMPAGVPRYVRCYDNGGRTVDRFTIVYTGRYPGRPRGWTLVLGASENPYHPQGVGMHAEYPGAVDRPAYGHLGRRVAFTDLPDPVRRAVLEDYRGLWDLEPATA